MTLSTPRPARSTAPSRPTEPPATPRDRYRRGEGARLADDIVEAARQILEREGNVEAVTLRAVARQIGIAAPSIYRHFPDRDAIVEAVEAATFDELEARIAAGTVGSDDPVERLVGGCLGYVNFALEYPGRYQILFNQLRGTHGEKPVITRRSRELTGLSVFHVLLAAVEACVASGRSASTDPFAASTTIWAALHGVATLRSNTPNFPWQPVATSVREAVVALARIT